MELQHTFTVPAPVEQAWATLLDVEGVAPCFPGATLTSTDGDEFAGTVKVKLGPVSLQYAGKGRFVERDADQHLAVIEAHGSDKRGNGTAGATVHARLESAGESSTRVVVDTELKVTGRPAQFGRGVMQDVSGRIIEQFAGCLAQRMAGEPSTPEPSPPSQDEPQAPSTTMAGSPGSTSAQPSSHAAAGNGAMTSRPAAPRPDAGASEHLDLNQVVLPALARRYGPPVLALLVLLLVGVRALRRRR